MKEVLLLRHTKSEWKGDFEADHERPLAPRGVRAAGVIGTFLEKAEMIPELAISSSAARTRETLDLIVKRLGRKGGFRREVTGDLYDSSPGRVLEVIREIPTTVSRALLVGHNPTWETALSTLVGGGRFRLPTGALALVQFDVAEWSEVAPGQGTVRWLVVPKVLEALGVS